MTELAIKIHMGVIILLILSQLAFFLIKKEDNFIKFSKKFRNLLPAQNTILAMIIFTGLLVMAVSKFTLWNIEIILMIILFLAIFVYQIVLYKKVRVIKSNEFDLQIRFKEYASKIYLYMVLAEIAVFIISLILG